MTDRDALNHMIQSFWFQRVYRPMSPTDARKIIAEYQGERRPTASSWFARGFVELCRNHPPPPPVQRLGWFDSRFAFVRHPQSGHEVEKLDALQAIGYRGVALNIEWGTDSWFRWVTLARVRSLDVIPWMRCYLSGRGVRMVRMAAEEWGSPALIVNLEQNAIVDPGGEPRWSMSGSDAAAVLSGFPGDIGVSTEPWMPTNFDWAPLRRLGAVALPQAFQNEKPAWTPGVVVARCRELGWTRVAPTFGTYTVTFESVTARTDYVWDGPFSIYTLDDVPVGQVASWA
jgi:hypothetical protein